MQKIILICLGKIKENFIKEAIAEYQKRINKFFDFQIIELEDLKINDKINDANINHTLEKESIKILEKIKGQNVCSLCVEGKHLDSIDFANYIDKKAISGTLYFIIGSSYGLSENIKNLGDKISFSKMTFPHQLMRLIFTEQLYRAGTILNNIEYHK